MYFNELFYKIAENQIKIVKFWQKNLPKFFWLKNFEQQFELNKKLSYFMKDNWTKRNN